MSLPAPVLILQYFFHAIARPIDNRCLGVVKQSVEQRRCQGAVVVEDLGPILECPIGGDDDRSLFISLADNLEEQVCAAFYQWGDTPTRLISVKKASDIFSVPALAVRRVELRPGC